MSNTTPPVNPALEPTQRSPQCWGYFVLSPEDEVPADVYGDLTQRAEEHFRALQAQGQLSGVEWVDCLFDDAIEWPTPLRERPQGGQLDHDLAAGDVVIFATLQRSLADFADLAAVVDTWSNRDVHIHFADPDFAQAGAELSAADMRRTILTAMRMVEAFSRPH